MADKALIGILEHLMMGIAQPTQSLEKPWFFRTPLSRTQITKRGSFDASAPTAISGSMPSGACWNPPMSLIQHRETQALHFSRPVRR